MCNFVIQPNISTSDATLTRGGADKFITVRLNKSFPVSWNGFPIEFDIIGIVRPSPIRIENVQHDAVLIFVSVDRRSRLLVPLVGSGSPGKQGEFVNKLTRNLMGIMTPDPNTNTFPIVPVSTGSDWSLTQLIPVVDIGGQPMVRDGYFIWSERGFTYVMMETPVGISTTDMSLLQMLPAETSNIRTPSFFMYRPGNPNCKTPVLTPIPQTRPEPPSVDFIGLVIGVVGAIAFLLAIYYALQWATSSKGDIFKNFGESLGGKIGIKKKVQGDLEFSVENPMLKAVKKQSPIVEDIRDASPVIPDVKDKDLFPAIKDVPIDKSGLFQMEKTPSNRVLFTNPAFQKTRPPPPGRPTSGQESAANRRKLIDDLKKAKGVYHPTEQEMRDAAGVGPIRDIERAKEAKGVLPPPLPPAYTPEQKEAIKENEDLDKAMKEKLERLKRETGILSPPTPPTPPPRPVDARRTKRRNIVSSDRELTDTAVKRRNIVSSDRDLRTRRNRDLAITDLSLRRLEEARKTDTRAR